MTLLRTFSLVILALVSQTLVVLAQGGPTGTAFTRLRGFEEVPSLFTPGGGSFTGRIREDGQFIYEFTFRAIPGVTQAHVHFAQRGVNGGILFFLCTNLGNGPPGTPTCPNPGGTVRGRITAAKIEPTNQGIEAGQLAAAMRAIRAGFAYVNVHSNEFPGGEIRGQLQFTPD